MAKIYVFGIGGTGSRVLRALTMLLASGMDCGDADTVVPIIIDVDGAGGDVTRVRNLMECYGNIRRTLTFTENQKNKFFRTKIEDIGDERFLITLQNTGETFQEYIKWDKGGLTNENKALAKVLFSERDLRSNMEMGFKGYPHIGSVVMNQLEDSPVYQNFVNNFAAGDRIFIISSIFGGTGASGFPLLLKKMRKSENQLISRAEIGAITVLPYFKVAPQRNSAIDSTTFISKMKSALLYYNRTIYNNNDLDYSYYIADNEATTYSNYEGGVLQKNNAHFVELAAALAVLDFAKSNRNPRNQQNERQTCFKEFKDATDNNNNVDFLILQDDYFNLLKKSMTQFILLAKFMDEAYDYWHQPWIKCSKIKSDFFAEQNSFITNLREFLCQYRHWLAEQSTQNRNFAPFMVKYHLDKQNEIVLEKSSSKELFKVVNGIEPSTDWQSLDTDYNLFNNYLNHVSFFGKCEGSNSQQFMELFYLATERIIKRKIKVLDLNNND